MELKKDFIDLIGNTPLLRLKRASEETGCEILGKCEFLNPGESVKDRAALFIVRDAEAQGTLRPGGVIVEGEHVSGGSREELHQPQRSLPRTGEAISDRDSSRPLSGLVCAK